MNFYQALAATLLKVWSVTIIIWGVHTLVSFALMWPSQETQDSARFYIFAQYASYALYFGAGVAVWFFAAPLGARIGAGFAASEPALMIEAERLISIGCFLVGLYFMIEYGPRALTASLSLLIDAAQQTDAERLTGVQFISMGWREVVINWATTLAALLVSVKARGVAKLFGWLRHVGVASGEPAPARDERPA